MENFVRNDQAQKKWLPVMQQVIPPSGIASPNIWGGEKCLILGE